MEGRQVFRGGARGGIQSRSSRASPSPRPQLPPVFLDWRSVRFVFRGLPPNITTLDLWKSLKDYGEIVSIDIDDSRPGERASGYRSARVLFSPPPHNTTFYNQQSGKCKILLSNGHELWATIGLDCKQDKSRTVQSPTGQDCPLERSIQASTAAFGFFLEPEVVMEKNTVVSGGDVGDIKAAVNFDYKKINLELNMPLRQTHGGGVMDYRLQRCEIRFDALSRSKIYRIALPNNRWGLVIDLDDPPVWLRRKAKTENTHRQDRNRWLAYQDTWYRLTDVATENTDISDIRYSLDVEPPNLDIGRWTTYWLEFPKATEEQWRVLESLLKDWNVKVILDAPLKLTPGMKPGLWDILEETGSAQTGQSISNSDDLAQMFGSGRIHLPFDIRYQLEVCLAQGVFNEHNITRSFIEKLAQLASPENKATDRARLLLEYASEREQRIFDPMSLFDDKAAMSYWPASIHIPDHCALVKRAVITPTRIIFKTPTVETTNRVLRYYKQQQGYFLRLQFTDELHHGALRSEGSQNDGLYGRMFQILRNGIWIGPHHWEFLAFGNSQIREGGVFFFCAPDNDRQGQYAYDQMIKWMGDFSHIKTVAKYAARIGQCFSTTRLVQGINVPKLVPIPDVERYGYCFSDGVGKMSNLIASIVADSWRHNWRPTEPPSAIQFRLAGCKGVLALWEDVEPRAVHIRKSQEKFPAECQGLEIVRLAQFSVASLNRQSIIILTSLGIPASVFVNMTKEQLEGYDKAMNPDNKALTIELLEKHLDENQITLEIADMVRNGFMKAKDPFVCSTVQLWKIWSIGLLKEKARLLVDKSAFLLGVLDETGTLRGYIKDTEGRPDIKSDELPQIFLQIRDPKDPDQCKVITGICIVGRNPSLHPGDIRVVEAVDVPQLKHLKDVVVFPRTGDRDVPSMCSGGDLDGDDFFVIWDQNLIPNRTEWGFPPMNYTEPAVEEEIPRRDTVMQFFVLYMKNNVLPLIATSHLARADFDGAKHPKCLELAEKHSTAVDYLKTGVCADYDPRDDNPRYWPHWMEKSNKRSMQSKSALGQMYDLIGHEDFKPNYEQPFDKRILSRFTDLDKDLLQKARKLKCHYDTAMRRLMGQFEIRTEFEIWTTFSLSKPRVGSAYRLQERLGREVSAIKQIYRDACEKEFGAQTYDKDKIDRFVAAMYQITSEEVRIALIEQKLPFTRPDGTVVCRKISRRFTTLISFPWLFPEALGRIATRGASGQRLSQARPTMDERTQEPVAELETEIQLMERPAGYMRTDGGLIVHHGEILTLFHNEDDDDDEEEGREFGHNWPEPLDSPFQELLALEPPIITHDENLPVSDTPVSDTPVSNTPSSEMQNGGNIEDEQVNAEDGLFEEILLDIDAGGQPESSLERLNRLGFSYRDGDGDIHVSEPIQSTSR